MSRNKILVCVFIFILLFPLIFMLNMNVKANNESSSSHFTGNYEGDVSILYFWENPMFIPPIFWNINRSSTLLPPNGTNTQNFVFSANSLEIRASRFLENSTTITKIIADNTSDFKNVTNAVKIAQQFNISTLCSIQSVSLFLNHTLKSNYYGIVSIADENLSVISNSWEQWFSLQMSTWANFWLFGNVIEPSRNYYIIFQMFLDLNAGGIGPVETSPRNHSWKAQDYNSSDYNKGETVTFNGSAWNPIPNDSTTDMLCKIAYVNILTPESANFTISIDNETKPYQKRVADWGGDGYEVFYVMKFPTPPIQAFNLTITSNISLTFLNFFVRLFYVHTVGISGCYNASTSNIKWTLSYPHINVRDAWALPEAMFAFEYDWDYLDFLDPEGMPVSDIYFGPLFFYNKSYYGLFQLPFMGLSLEPGTHTGHFMSPNYCHTIQGKVKGASGFQTASSFELGQTVQLAALITDSKNNPISGGNATINLTSPSGQLIHHQTNISSINSLINTSEIQIQDTFETGLYTISVFWTNGCEVGFYTMQIEVVEPPSMLMTYILLGLGFGLAIVAIPLGTYTRRKIQMRNWEKHLQNLFVLTKDGRSIYGYSFGIEIQDPSLVSAALVAITTFVTDAVKSKKELRVIDLQDKKVLLSHGKDTTIALIAEKDFPIIRNRTEDFTRAFETQYGGKVAAWRGDSKTFKGVDALIQDYFPVSMEERITRGVKLKLIETKELLKTAEDPLVIIQIMKEVTQLLSRYREIIEKYYMQDYAELIKAAEEKMNSISF